MKRLFQTDSDPFAEVKAAVDIVDLFTRRGVKLQRSGARSKCCCIFHAEDTPSMTLYPNGTFYCFGCQKSGTVIDAEMQFTGTDAVTAARSLDREYSVGAFSDGWEKRHEKRLSDQAARIQALRSEHAEAVDVLQSAARGLRAKADQAAEREVADGIISNAEMAEAAAGFVFDERDPEAAVSLMLGTLRLVGEEEAAAEIEERHEPPREPPRKRRTLPPPVDLSKIADVDDTPFLWYPYIPMHEVTILAAPGGTGKGFLAALIAARLSQGLGFDALEYERCPIRQQGIKDGEKVKTLFLSNEDGASRIKPRFLESNGDIRFLSVYDSTIMEEDGVTPFLWGIDFTEQDGLDQLQDMIDATGARLVVIDPLADFVGGRSLNAGEDVRKIISGLSAVSRKKDVAILAITHTKKKGLDAPDMLDTVAGSHELRDVARSVLMIDYDIEDEKTREGKKKTNRRLILHVKSNHANIGKTVRYYIAANQDGRAGGHFPYSDSGFSTFSDVTEELFSTASRQKMSPRALLDAQRISEQAKSDREAGLVAAIRAEVEEMRKSGEQEVRFSYNQFSERHGAEIWDGDTQQNKLLRGIAGQFTPEGVALEWQNVRGTDGKRGFKISVSAIPKSGE